MKKLLIATTALVLMAASPAMAAGCCGKKGMCAKSSSMAMGKGKCCCEGKGKGMQMSTRQS